MSQNKHAFLIVAHNNFSVLERLLMLLDDERNDLFVHVDAKVQNFDESRFQKLIKNAELIFLKKRIKVKWAHVTVAKAELRLMEAAASKRSYDYYHLVSGADLPLLTPDAFHAFFAQHQGEEFISILPDNLSLPHRVELITVLAANPLPQNWWQRKSNKIMFKCLTLQRKLGLKPMSYFLPEIKRGSQWASLTDDCVRYIINRMKKELKWYQWSSCADEHYKQTCIYHSPFLEKVSKHESMRCIDWERNNGRSPYTYRLEDFDTIIKSQKAFARKFDETVDFDIVEKICEHLNTQL